MSDNLIKLKLLTGESDEKLLSFCLEEAEQRVLAYTRRVKILNEFNYKVIEIAQAMYERRGVGSVSSLSEGGISQSFISYDAMLQDLKNYRLAKVGGLYAKKEDEEI